MFRTWWFRHRTKTLGFVMTLCGALQANIGYVQAYFRPQHYGWIMCGTGMLVAALGFLNNHDHRGDDNGTA